MNLARLVTFTSLVLVLACSRVPEDDARPPATTAGAEDERPASSTRGTILGEPWSFVIVDDQAQLHVGDRVVPLQRNDACFVTDELHGCWSDPAEIADALIRYHPDFSPLARGCSGIAVEVVDPEGRAIAGARITPTLSAMVGPAGAFGVEGGRFERFERPIVETDAEGAACVPDERGTIAELHRQRHGASTSSFDGVEVRFTKLTLEISHASWSPAVLELAGDEARASEPLEVRLESR